MKKILLINLLILQAFIGFSQTSMAAAELQKDTLYAKRVFVWTNIYKNSLHIPNSFVKKALKLDSQASIKYTWGKVLQPVGPVFVVGGIVLMANGLRGVDKSINIDGVDYNYTDRSLTKTLLGLVTSALGICLIESSNELIQHSVAIYNDSVMNRKHKVSYKLGITPEGNIGLAMNF